MDEKNKNDTITIKKDDLWKYSTFVLLAIVIIGAIVMFSGGNGGSGNTVIQQGGPTGVTAYKAYAKEINLDTAKFDSCLENKKYLDKVKEDYDLGNENSEGNGLGTPSFFINGRLLSGALPFALFKEAIDAELTAGSVNPIALRANDHLIGEKDAPVTIVEYSDFMCPFCARHHTQTSKQIEKEYIETGKVNFVYRHYNPTFVNPSYHMGAIEASIASECAGEQGKFWEMHDLLFEKGV